MTKKQALPVITEIPNDEQESFDKLIKACRKKHIRTSQEIVDKVFKEKPIYLKKVDSTHKCTTSNLLALTPVFS
ncbi:MAG: hypothetical protein A6F71_05500 [Cycloclasticus sp. symbiont of Poecilosclerida sp. M]|nr:MAG: hypothetical protein A6F71_05500 [Cycloclasticus sp. symbiont of Poecilosclerida sp. M]